LFLSRQTPLRHIEHDLWLHGQSNNFIADVFLGRQTQPEGSLPCAPTFDFIRKGKADSLARLRAESWFSA
jgi:hypothetical protein